MTSGAFDRLVPDVLGEPYLAETIALPPDEEGPVVATLVVRRAEQSTGRAVLHVHGFCDYFFQTEYAEWWNARGYDFYAVDLRKYGRSLRPHQTPNYVTDLREHFPELDAALHRIVVRDGHDHVVVSAHSTGGLISALWANERRPDIAGMVLNSPWLDMQGGALLRGIGTKAIKQIGARRPKRGPPSAGSARSASATTSCTPGWRSAARRWCSPRPGRAGPRRWARTRTATTSCSRCPRSGSGPPPSAAG